MSPSRKTPELFQCVALFQYFTYNIESDSLSIEKKRNLLVDLILILERAADNLQYLQREQVFGSLTLYEEAFKHTQHLWQLEENLCFSQVLDNIAQRLQPNNDDNSYPIFKKAMTREQQLADFDSLDDVSSATLQNVLKKSCLFAFPPTWNKEVGEEYVDATQNNTNSNETQNTFQSEAVQRETGVSQNATSRKTDQSTPSPSHTFQRASEWLHKNKTNSTNCNANHQTKKQPVKKKGFQVPRRLGDDYNESQTGLPSKDEDSQLPQIPNVEPKLVELITNEVLEINPGVGWNDIAGLEFAKSCVMEAVVWPMMRPDIFSGIRRPPKGLLLFGPPGTGKTMIGRAIASRAGATFFNISASSLTSKWVGESEKMVRALFGVAKCYQPAVIFIDEIDSLLTQRSESDQESSRRLKTEFLVQMDGAASTDEDRILIVGATNRPQELDEAARRRLIKRLYIPLPDSSARKCLISRLIESQKHSLTEEQLEVLMEKTQGYSGSDLRALCAEAAMSPLRELGEQLENISLENVRPIDYDDFVSALRLVRASVATTDLEVYKKWNDQYGSFPIQST